MRHRSAASELSSESKPIGAMDLCNRIESREESALRSDTQALARSADIAPPIQPHAGWALCCGFEHRDRATLGRGSPYRPPGSWPTRHARSNLDAGGALA